MNNILMFLSEIGNKTKRNKKILIYSKEKSEKGDK